MPRIPRSELTDYEWYHGDLSWQLRRHGQTRIYKFIHAWKYEGAEVKPIVVNAHRRLGKSYLNALMAIDAAKATPNYIVKLICGEKEQVRDVYEPLIYQILETCPPDLYPKVRGTRLYFENPAWPTKGRSLLQLCGANYKKGDMARGTACDRAFLDEVRDFKELEYFVTAVLSHQFQGRPDPCLVITSTPPWTMDHPFTRPETGYIPRSMVDGRYICVPGSENPDFTERDKRIVLGMIPGGEKDPAYQREVECKLISDVGRLIIPEYQTAHEEVAVEEIVRPDFFLPYVVIDSGFDPDYTAIIFGYPDFLSQHLVVEAEVVEKRMATRRIADATRAMMEKLEYDKQWYKPILLADMDERGVTDLRREYKLSFLPVEKYDSKSGVATFRSRIGDRAFRLVKPGCPQLHYQLLHGIWDDAEKHKDFARSETLGHCDALKAAIYFNRMANFRFNPYPAGWRSGMLSSERKRLTGNSTSAILRALGR